MPDFSFKHNPYTNSWVILDTARAKRPKTMHSEHAVCPFCPGGGSEEREPSVYEVKKSEIRSTKTETNSSVQNLDSGVVVSPPQNDVILAIRQLAERPESASDWALRVIKNKFPFAEIHEVIIHSPEHSATFESSADEMNALVFETYRERFRTHATKGLVYIFNNHGEKAGESLPHPHSQLAVLPHTMLQQIPSLPRELEEEVIETDHFLVFCPAASQWPDEVMFVPKQRGSVFSSISDEALRELSSLVPKVTRGLVGKLEEDFPYNFYIYPSLDWYLRLIPRGKTMGGLEVGANVFVNSHDPKDTFELIKASIKL